MAPWASFITHFGRSSIDRARRAVCLVACLWLSMPAVSGGNPDSGSVAYTGPISSENNRLFFARLDDSPVRRLRIRSSGGEVEAGIELGLWVFEQGLDVVVSGYCLSSCANYVFTAGRRKTIEAGAVVAWHGNYHHLQATGLWRDDVAARMQRTGEDAVAATAGVRAQMLHLVRLEEAFFNRIGVDQRLCWVGKMPPYNAPNYYFLSLADMARFGVHSVQAADDYVATDVSGLDQHIVYLPL